MPTAPQVESWLYVDLAGLRSIQITDVGGGPFTLTLPNDMEVETALAQWQALATGHATLAETYTFVWEPTTQTVEFTATGNFTLTLDGSLPAAFGFTLATMGGGDSYASDLAPKAIANPINVHYDPPWPATETELRRYRWGRVSARVHNRAMVTTFTVLMYAAQATQLLAGPLFAGRIRLFPFGFVAGQYAANNLRGYFDAYPFEIPQAHPMGSGDGQVEVVFAAAVVF